jgi:hypothetical protein
MKYDGIRTESLAPPGEALPQGELMPPGEALPQGELMPPGEALLRGDENRMLRLMMRPS